MSNKKRICFDADGVLVQDCDPTVPYSERKPYPQAVVALKRLKEEGHTIVVLTARYMNKFDGDQKRASEYGRMELVWWLKENEIPYDEVVLGKPSSDLYVDDKAFHLNSNHPLSHARWDALLKWAAGVSSPLCPSTNSPVSAVTPGPTSSP